MCKAARAIFKRRLMSFRSAHRDRVIRTRGNPMNLSLNSLRAILKEPSAFLPLTMSLAALWS